MPGGCTGRRFPVLYFAWQENPIRWGGNKGLNDMKQEYTHSYFQEYPPKKNP